MHEASLCYTGALATSSDGRGVPADAVTFQRLLTEVFSKDVAELQHYCEGVREWADGCRFLDEVDGGGWHMLDLLLQGEAECADVAECPFLTAQH